MSVRLGGLALDAGRHPEQCEDGRAAGWALGRLSPTPDHPVPRYARCCASQALITEMDASSPVYYRSYKAKGETEGVLGFYNHR
jgi:hypothetical protein